MKKIILFSISIMIMAGTVMGQEDKIKNNKSKHSTKVVQEQAGRPDLPGDFIFEFGLTYLSDAPDNMQMNLWGSKTINIYYQYPIQFGESSFYIFPGIGISTQKYKFNENVTLGYSTDDLGNRVVDIVHLDSIFTNASYKKSKIGTVYTDFIFELRWISRNNNPRQSIKVAVGGRIGYNIDSKTKVKYDQYGETKKTKQKEDFALSEIRYGVYGKIGYASFNTYFYYSLSPLFETNKGPSRTSTSALEFGLSLTIF